MEVVQQRAPDRLGDREGERGTGRERGGQGGREGVSTVPQGVQLAILSNLRN